MRAQRAAALGCLLLALSVHAHPLDLGRVELLCNGPEALLTVELHPLQAAHIFGVPVEQLASPALLPTLRGRAGLSADGSPCVLDAGPRSVQLRADARGATLAWALRCTHFPTRTLELSLPWLTNADATLQLVGQAHLPTGDVPMTLSPARPTVTLPLRASLGLADFVLLGVHHIGAAPSEWRDARGWHLPEGMDHILFLLALVLGGGTLRQILLTITGFTLGHSITLALASLGLVSLPSRWVEAAIAFSIVYVAAEDVLRRGARHRWVVATAFGLIHGFGFASAVKEIGLAGKSLLEALLGFNVGVELGQAVIVLALTPLLVWMRRASSLGRATQRALSVAVLLVALRWLVMRLG